MPNLLHLNLDAYHRESPFSRVDIDIQHAFVDLLPRIRTLELLGDLTSGQETGTLADFRNLEHLSIARPTAAFQAQLLRNCDSFQLQTLHLTFEFHSIFAAVGPLNPSSHLQRLEKQYLKYMELKEKLGAKRLYLYGIHEKYINQLATSPPEASRGGNLGAAEVSVLGGVLWS
jgi:hypothetical protein